MIEPLEMLSASSPVVNDYRVVQEFRCGSVDNLRSGLKQLLRSRFILSG
jgi:hypothetical protein